MTYAEHRALRIAMANEYEGYDTPPYPGNPPCIGRIIMTGPDAGFYPYPQRARFDLEAKAREIRQNRSLPK